MILFPVIVSNFSKRVVSSGLIVPTVNFTSGISSSYDLTQHVTGWNSNTMQLILQGTSLPSSVIFNGTHLVYDGTGGSTSVDGIILVIIPL